MTLHDTGQIYNFLFFSLGSFLISMIMLLCGFFLGAKSNSENNRDLPFESGVNAFGRKNLQIPIHFSLFAIFFVIFDVESCYLYLWSVNIMEVGWVGFLEMSFFIIIFLITIIYLIKTNMLKWILS